MNENRVAPGSLKWKRHAATEVPSLQYGLNDPAPWLTFAWAYIWCNHMSGLGSSANPWGDCSSRWQLACHQARTIGRTTQLTPSDPRHSDTAWNNKGTLFSPPKKRGSLLCNNRLIQVWHQNQNSGYSFGITKEALTIVKQNPTATKTLLAEASWSWIRI